MYTEVIAMTQPLVRTEDNTRFLNLEEFIVFCARVSNPENQLNLETADKLIRYCIKHGHWSIFEQASITVAIQTSRDISAQIIRHRSFSFQEFSQRYSQPPGLESFDIRKQAEKNRQSSSDVIDLPEEDLEEIKNYLNNGLNLYKKYVEKGAAKESMRKILPLCTQTTLYMTGNIRSWIHYLSVRTREDTQLEHREIALSIQKSLESLCPVIFNNLNLSAFFDNLNPSIEKKENKIKKGLEESVCIL